MQKEQITPVQGGCIIVTFIIGSNIILGGNTEAGRDTWLAILLSVIMAMPIVLVFARIIKLAPGMGIFELTETLYGKVAGKMLNILMTWYALHLGALVLRNFQEFIEITALNQTPPIIISMVMVLTTMYVAKSGVQTFGRWAIITLPVITLVVIFTTIFSLPHSHVSNLLPIMEHKISSLVSYAYRLFAFPFAETVLVLALAASFKKHDSAKKIYVGSILVGGTILLIVAIRNVMVLGEAMMQHEYFPSYTTARIIEIGDFITRIEGTISFNFILAGIGKITVCLFAASKGLASLVNSQNYKNMVVPAGLFMLALGSVVYKNIIEMVDFLRVYQIYAIPFQIIIPLVIWIGAEIKTKRGKKQLV